jgi:hypothetical protein
MPLIAVGIAVVADIGVGAAGFGAVLAGTASLATTFAAVGAIGATISAVGAVTGVKALQTAGLVLGGIGGVGALANAVGAFGDGATLSSVFGSSPTTAGAAAGQDTASLINGGQINETTGTDLTANGSNSSDILSTANALGGVNETTGTNIDAATGDPLSATANPTSTTDSLANGIKGDTLQSTSSATGSPTSDLPSGSPTDSASIAKAGTTPSNIPTTDSNWLNNQFPNPLDGTLAKAPGGQSYTYSSANGWAPQVASGIGGFLGSQGGGLIGMGVIQAAGSFLSGAFNPLTPAQVSAYQAQANANNASAALTNKQVSNMSEPIPTARRQAVTGAPGGLMNSAGAAAS